MNTPSVISWRPLLAAVTAGVALWLSRASFDVAGTSDAPMRVAMLPSGAELLGLVVLALLTAAGIASMRRGTPDETPFWGAAADALRPLFALGVLVLPYLPLLPDWVPAIRVLAGPARIFVWIAVLGQVAGLLSPRLSASAAGLVFACAAVFLSAPFVMNVRAMPAAFGDLFGTLQHLPSANLAAVPSGSLGVLFDQEYGIFAYAPVLVLAFVGLAGMLRERPRQALPIAVAAVVLVVLAGTADPWWSRSMLPGRPVVLLLPLLVFPLAWLYARLPDESLQRAGALLLLFVSLAITALVVTGRVSARQEGDGMSSLLYWMSPTWHVWSEGPSLVGGVTAGAVVRIIMWLAVLGIGALAVRRRAAVSPGRSSLVVTTWGIAAAIAGISMSSAVLTSADKRFDAEARVLLPLLETFDPVARPIAVRYDPFSIVAPSDLPPLFTVSAVPGSRTAPQPVRVVLNARFRLPAGEYVLALDGAPSAKPLPDSAIALQVGREGRPVHAWSFSLAPGAHLEERFELPLDSEFVGFRAPRQVEEHIAKLRVTPVSIIETRRRFAAATVLSAASFAPGTIFFHDSNAYPEPEGFWVKGRAAARMTLKKNGADSHLILAMHSGAQANSVQVSVPGWSHVLDLVPGVTERLEVPLKDGEAFVPLTIAATGGFVPAEIETSRDRRLLGAWVAFIPDDTSRTSAVP